MGSGEGQLFVLPQPVRAHLGTAAGCHRLKGRPGGGSPAPLLRDSRARPQPPGAAAPSPPRVTARPWSSAEPPRRGRRAREMAARWALRRRGRGAPGLRGLPAAAGLRAGGSRRRPGRRPAASGRSTAGAGPVRAASCPHPPAPRCPCYCGDLGGRSGRQAG